MTDRLRPALMLIFYATRGWRNAPDSGGAMRPDLGGGLSPDWTGGMLRYAQLDLKGIKRYLGTYKGQWPRDVEGGLYSLGELVISWIRSTKVGFSRELLL